MKFTVLQNFTYDGKRFNIGDEIPEKFYTFDEFKMMSMHGKINISKEPIVETAKEINEEILVKELVSDIQTEEVYTNLINKEEIEKSIINDLINEEVKENVSEKQIKKEEKNEKSKKTGKRKRNS